MAKTRKHRSRKNHKRNIIGNLKKTTRRMVPAVKSGLKTVGTKVEQTASKTKPYVEKGISSVYGVLSEGFNLGVKGVEKVIKTKSKNSRKSRKSRK